MKALILASSALGSRKRGGREELGKIKNGGGVGTHETRCDGVQDHDVRQGAGGRGRVLGDVVGVRAGEIPQDAHGAVADDGAVALVLVAGTVACQ